MYLNVAMSSMCRIPCIAFERVHITVLVHVNALNQTAEQEYLISLSLLSHRAAMQIRVMIIWLWMRLVGSRRPLVASLQRLHLHKSWKHTPQEHHNNNNHSNDPHNPPLPGFRTRHAL